MGPLPPLLLCGDACAAHAARLLHQHLEQLSRILVEQAPPCPLQIYPAGVRDTLCQSSMCSSVTEGASKYFERDMDLYRCLQKAREDCGSNAPWHSSVI